MSFFSSFKVLKILFEGRNTKVFFFLTVIGFAFSIAVILSNFGLMNGYESVLKKGLRSFGADIEITSDYGFYKLDQRLLKKLDKEEIESFSGVLRVEGFIISKKKSRGVLINGVQAKNDIVLEKLKVKNFSTDGIMIGSAIASELNLQVDDYATIAFSRGNQSSENLPYIKELKVTKIINHGVYKKDSRVVYCDQSFLQKFANTEDKVNVTLLKVGEEYNDDYIRNKVKSLSSSLGYGFRVRPYWNDFKTLIEAVEVEKFSITIILQLIILISLFNIVAFVNFNRVSKSQEFFLLRALGTSQKVISWVWVNLVLSIWLLGCLLSLVFLIIFDKVILRLPFLKIPKEVYELDYLSLELSSSVVLGVFGLIFIWSLLVAVFISFKQKKISILAGLRQRFS